MKVVILAGGLGTRISEETHLKPKPMIEIGGMPILWHILKHFSSFGINNFIICCGYKGYMIKEFFQNYFLHMSDVTFDMKANAMKVHHNNVEPWTVTLVDTGEHTMTGGRLKRIRNYLLDDKEFCFTYGDAVSNVNITELIKFHKNKKKLATVTATLPPGRYGAIKFSTQDLVSSFKEKTDGDGSWINGGYFVMNPEVIERIKDDNTSWEHEPLASLAKDNELAAFKHKGFWQPMDTLREKNYLNELWQKGNPPWKIW